LPNCINTNTIGTSNDRRKSSNFSDTSSNDSKDSLDISQLSKGTTPPSSKFKAPKEEAIDQLHLETPVKEEKKENMLSTVSSDKESCLICMERMREVVFMPCCHFLTCPLCTPKLTNCPICNKKIEKHLKIYWC